MKTTLAVFGVLVGAGAALTTPWWQATQPWWLLSLVLLALVLGAGIIGSCVRRLVEPSLPVPWPVWIGLGVFWVMAMIGAAQRREAEGRLPHEDSSKPSTIDERRPIGRVRAVFALLLGIVYYGGAIAFLYLKQRGIVG